MLDNVDYVYPGSLCKPNYYAYVYPSPPHLARDAQGQYIFHLRDLYLQSTDEVMIETLTHEGSHHMQMDTEDSVTIVNNDEVTLYGQRLCGLTASKCSLSNNPDS